MRRYDEDDVRIRPGKGSRPRTRLRPAHADARDAFVVAIDRGRYTCLLLDSGPNRVIEAMKARELGRGRIVVGDRVGVVGDTSGDPGSLGRIVRISPRRSELRRSADDTDASERVIVANADTMMIVTALADPEPRLGMIDRCMVAAFDARITPILALTKADLAAPDELIAAYAPLGVETIVSGKDDFAADVDMIRERLTGHVSVLVGHSGVGKSTLTNELVPAAERAIGAVNAVTGRGRHTTTSAIAFELPSGGWVIDTPGVRSFGLGHVRAATVIAAFPDIAAAAEDCPRGCNHLDPSCTLDDSIDAERLTRLRRLLTALAD